VSRTVEAPRGTAGPPDISRYPHVPADLAATICGAVAALDGWCTEHKALFMAEQILRYGYRRGVEIGVFGGRSVVPIALAMNLLGGEVSGIDAWSRTVAVEDPINRGDTEWWTNVDLTAVKRRFLSYLADSEVAEIIRIIEAPSRDAVRLFRRRRSGERVDFLHIDGGHSEAQALGDARRWIGVVRPGGMIVLDDFHWPSVLSARRFLRSRCATVAEIVQPDETGFAAYRVGRLSAVPDPLWAGARLLRTVAERFRLQRRGENC
jgi:methyltransferase family protein